MRHGNLINSYWVADKSSLNGLIDNLMSGKTIAVVQGVQQISPTPITKDQNADKEEIKVGERGTRKNLITKNEPNYLVLATAVSMTT